MPPPQRQHFLPLAPVFLLQQRATSSSTSKIPDSTWLCLTAEPRPQYIQPTCTSQPQSHALISCSKQPTVKKPRQTVSSMSRSAPRHTACRASVSASHLHRSMADTGANSQGARKHPESRSPRRRRQFSQGIWLRLIQSYLSVDHHIPTLQTPRSSCDPTSRATRAQVILRFHPDDLMY